MEPLISVIVPVYNVEKYLHKCINSILKQTYCNIEVILVDDGSPDGCPEICDKYAEADSRVTVLHKKNGGVSSARNAGLEKMNGEYVCFVDSDDYLPENALKDLCSAAEGNKVPYVVGICKIAGSNLFKNNIKEMYEFSPKEKPEELLSYIVGNGSYSPYAKLYSAEIIKTNCLRFREDMKIAEDTVFLRTYLRYCKTVCMIPSVVYEYTADNIDSLSKKAYEEYCSLYGEKMKSVEALINTLPLSEGRKKEFLSERAINGIILSINHYYDHWKEKEKVIGFFKKTAEELLYWADIDFDKEIIKKNKWWNANYDDFRKENYESIYNRISIMKKLVLLRKKAGKLVRFVKGNRTSD